MSNRDAFLTMISVSEGTARAPNPYAVCYGFSHTITNFANHPALTGEWPGVSISNLGPQYAHEISTAAGRYQINRPDWLALCTKIDLADFSPASQDAAAIELINEKGALPLIDAGNIALAIASVRSIWASLPGGSSGQPEHSTAMLLAAYTEAGGSIGTAT